MVLDWHIDMLNNMVLSRNVVGVLFVRNDAH